MRYLHTARRDEIGAYEMKDFMEVLMSHPMPQLDPIEERRESFRQTSFVGLGRVYCRQQAIGAARGSYSGTDYD